MDNLPPLNALKAFEGAGKTQNFRSAADELGVTQGAIAQQVRALEAHLGAKLFERHSKGLAFTSAGRTYHGQISHAFALIREATNTLKPSEASVLISVTPTFASKWLIPHLPEFSAKHPEIDLKVLATETVSSFYSDGIDLAVRQGKPPAVADLESHLLFKNEIVAVAAPTLVHGMKLPLEHGVLAGLHKLYDGHDLWSSFMPDSTGTTREGRGMRFNQTALAIDAAIAGQGVALASRFLVKRDVSAGRLVEVSSRTLRAKSDFYLILPKSKHRSGALKEVVDWLLSSAD